MSHNFSKSTLFQLIESGHLARLALLNPLPKYQLHPGDDAILLSLKKNKSTTDFELEKLTGLTPPLLQERLDRLQALRILQRTSFGDDFAPATKLTNSGRTIRKKLIAHWEDLEKVLMNELSHKEKKQFRHMLRKLADRLCL